MIKGAEHGVEPLRLNLDGGFARGGGGSQVELNPGMGDRLESLRWVAALDGFDDRIGPLHLAECPA